MSDAATLDATPDSSPASVAASSSSTVDLDSLSGAALDHWRLTGEIKTDAAAPVDSPATTDVEDRPASTEAKEAASEAAAPNKPESDDYKPKTEARIRQLLAERDEARREAAAAKAAQSTTKAPATASTAPSLESFIEQPPTDQPVLKEDAFFEQFPDASWADFGQYVTNRTIAVDRQRTEQRQQAERTQLAQRERVESFAKRVPPDVASALSPEVAALVPLDLLPPGTPGNQRNAFAQELIESEHGPALLALVNAQPELLAQVDALTSREAVIRFTARLESRVATSETPAAAPSKQVSDAPAPARTLGTRSKTPVDPIRAAIESDDFEAYRDAANAAEMAARR